MDSAIRKEIEELQRAPLAQVRARYRELFGEEPRSSHRQQLVRKLAWRLQALREGGLSEAARQGALEIAQAADLRMLPPRGFWENTPPAAATPGRVNPWHWDRRIPAPGALLKREYAGRTIVVKVLAAGFEHEGRHYGSLSAIAHQVTGTRWNGLAFFALTTGGRKKGGRRG